MFLTKSGPAHCNRPETHQVKDSGVFGVCDILFRPQHGGIDNTGCREEESLTSRYKRFSSHHVIISLACRTRSLLTFREIRRLMLLHQPVFCFLKFIIHVLHWLTRKQPWTELRWM